MQVATLNTLRIRAAELARRWEALLRTEKVTSPLANPDALLFLIPTMIERVLATLAEPSLRTATLMEAQRFSTRDCACGSNPYIAFFVAGEQALMEALVLAQTPASDREHRQEEVAELFGVTRRIALGEIEAFCAVCTAPRGAACANHSSRARGIVSVGAESSPMVSVPGSGVDDPREARRLRAR